MAVVGLTVTSNGFLIVAGDQGNDNVLVYTSGNSTIVRGTTITNVPFEANMGTNVRNIEIRTFGGNDVVTNATFLPSVIYWGEGNDTLKGGPGIDQIFGELGDDTIDGNGSNDRLFGGGGRDFISGNEGDDYIEGDDATINQLSEAAEALLPYQNGDVIYGGQGADKILGQLGLDRIYGGGWVDWIDGGRGNDILYGDDSLNSMSVPEDKQLSGNDSLYGGEGNDWLFGGYGNDKLFGGSGTDMISGGEGDDFIDSGSASESSFDGGNGNDYNAYRTAVNGAVTGDISQGNTGTCFILAAMGAVASRGIDLSSKISYTGFGNYSVSLFTKNANGTFTPTKVTVVFDGLVNPTDPTPHFRGQEGESWTVIMMRALSKHLNIDPSSNDGGLQNPVLEALLGRPSATVRWNDDVGPSPLNRDPILDYLFQVGNGFPTTVGTRNSYRELASGMFYEHHAYVVKSIWISSFVFNPTTREMIPQYSIELYNPYGFDMSARRLANGSGSFRGDNSDGVLIITGGNSSGTLMRSRSVDMNWDSTCPSTSNHWLVGHRWATARYHLEGKAL